MVWEVPPGSSCGGGGRHSMLIIEELGFVLHFHLPAFGRGLLQGFTPALPNCPPPPLSGLRLKVQQWLVVDTLGRGCPGL